MSDAQDFGTIRVTTYSKAPELLPCPFCGTAERDDHQERDHPDDRWLQVNEIAGPFFNVECFGCGVETSYTETADEAITAWNRRK